MNLFDVIGPIMIGPSSSHTAGAVRLGRLARELLGEPVVAADIGLHGSFARTGKGHGTDRALIAGLLGWQTDDARIPHSFEYAAQAGLAFHFEAVCLDDSAHPNTWSDRFYHLLTLCGNNELTGRMGNNIMETKTDRHAF